MLQYMAHILDLHKQSDAGRLTAHPRMFHTVHMFHGDASIYASICAARTPYVDAPSTSPGEMTSGRPPGPPAGTPEAHTHCRCATGCAILNRFLGTLRSSLSLLCSPSLSSLYLLCSSFSLFFIPCLNKCTFV